MSTCLLQTCTRWTVWRQFASTFCWVSGVTWGRSVSTASAPAIANAMPTTPAHSYSGAADKDTRSGAKQRRYRPVLEQPWYVKP